VLQLDALASCLQLPQQQCELLLSTLAAVGPQGSGVGAPAAPLAAAGGVSIHQLLLFLLAQMYGRDAHKPETQDHWPDAEARLARAVSPGAQRSAAPRRRRGGPCSGRRPRVRRRGPPRACVLAW
jgi:hypothetical protein